ncbi:MAG: hypothetical protein K0S51_1366 [Bacillales bacterium]|jgi:hypothetical protein|nr:hypothetical protein [Bacillales bacterium]
MFKKLIATVTTMILVLSPFTLVANAETNTVDLQKFPYKSVAIQVMPEYDYPQNYPTDQPVVLVGYYGTMTNKTGSDYNGEIAIPLPVNEKYFQIYIAAEFPEENKPEVQRPYKIDKEKGLITWKPSNPIKKDADYKFVVEYYSNPIEVGDSKKFPFVYTAPANVDAIDILFFAPAKSTDFKTDIPATTVSKTDYNETLLAYQYKNLKAGEKKAFNVSYVKKDNSSTLSNIKQNPPEANQSGSNTTTTESRPIIDAVGASIIGGSLIIMGFFIFLGYKQKGSTPPSKSNVKHKNSSTKQQQSAPKKNNSVSVMDEKKKLRKMLLNGEIDQETYELKLSKLE